MKDGFPLIVCPWRTGDGRMYGTMIPCPNVPLGEKDWLLLEARQEADRWRRMYEAKSLELAKAQAALDKRERHTAS